MTKRVSIIGSSVGASVVPGWNDYELMQFERAFMEEGIIEGVGTAFQVTERGAGPNMTVDVAPGRALIEITNTNVTHGKTYKVHFDSDEVENVIVTAADTTFERIDRIILRVDVATDPDGSAANIAIIENVAGTPSASPVAPPEPANAITLATISVPASDTQITDSQITDLRPYIEMKEGVMRKLARQGFINTHAKTVGGTADAITLTMNHVTSSYVDGYTVFFTATANNTGAVTVDIDGLGARSVKKNGNVNLEANDLQTNVIYGIAYNASSNTFKMITVVSNSPDGVPIGTGMMLFSNTAPTNYFICDGSAKSMTVYEALLDALDSDFYTFSGGANCTANTSTDELTATTHGLSDNDIVFFESSGTLPAGLSENTKYFVIKIDDDKFKVETSVGGGAVDITSTGSGTHSFKTQFDLPDLRGKFPMGVNDSGLPNGEDGTYQTRNEGEVGGEEDHQLTVSEMPSHNHQILGDHQTSNGSGRCVPNNGGPVSRNTASTGGNQAHNNIPPYLGVNWIVKYA